MEATGELATRIYSLIEAVKADGRLRKGANEATKGAERGEAKLVIIASDVNPQEVVMHLPMLCEEKNIPFVHVPAKNELGAAAGLPVGTSAVAIVLAGDAKRKLDEVLANLEALKKKPAPKEESKVEKKEEVKPKIKEEKPAEEVKIKEEPKTEKAEKKAEKPAKEKPKKEIKAEEKEAKKPKEISKRAEKKSESKPKEKPAEIKEEKK